MRILITGAGGLVGRALVAHASAHGAEVIARDHSALDITNADQIKAAFAESKPEVVINCAAWTNVDGCEDDPERAMNANALGPELLARECGRFNSQLITISTDYVFDGEKEGFYTQVDEPNPQSVYGRSKLAGEVRSQAAWRRTVIVRSGYIFGYGGTNFLSTILDRARRGERLRAIGDSFGTPTYARHLAQQLFELAKLNRPGVFHFVNSGEGASFEAFARMLLKEAGLDDSIIESTSLKDLKRPAPRPRNSRLRCLISESAGLAPMPLLTAAIREYIIEADSSQTTLPASV